MTTHTYSTARDHTYSTAILAERVRAVIAEQGRTVDDVADEAGISRETLRELLDDRHDWCLHHWCALMTVLDVFVSPEVPTVILERRDQMTMPELREHAHALGLSAGALMRCLSRM